MSAEHVYIGASDGRPCSACGDAKSAPVHVAGSSEAGSLGLTRDQLEVVRVEATDSQSELGSGAGSTPSPEAAAKRGFWRELRAYLNPVQGMWEDAQDEWKAENARLRAELTAARGERDELAQMAEVAQKATAHYVEGLEADLAQARARITELERLTDELRYEAESYMHDLEIQNAVVEAARDVWGSGGVVDSKLERLGAALAATIL